jgi:hypothetical protein
MATVVERFIETLEGELRQADETATGKQPRLKWLSFKSVRSESSLLRPYIDELDTIAMLKGIARPDVNFCTLPIDDVNPITVPITGTRNYLSCIDRRWWAGLRALSRLLAECIGHKSFALYVDPQGLDRVLPLLCELIEGGFCNEPPTDALARLGAYDRSRFWSIIDEAMHSALIAHEYAHFITGHFPRRATTVRIPLRKRGIPLVMYPALCTTWDDEFKADLVAMDLVMRRLGKHFADLPRRSEPSAGNPATTYAAGGNHGHPGYLLSAISAICR